MMRQLITFKIRESGKRPFVCTAVIDVPDNWHEMTIEDQREYLVRPTGNNMHPGQILHHTSRFQKATGAEDVEDFEFVSAC